jgi:hypothetical protein
VTAKDSKGNEIAKHTRIYMPIPQQLGRGDKMGRGPYEKSGIIRDNGLPPNKPVHEQFEIPFPAEFVKKDGKDVTNILDYEMTVDIELIYEPFGDKDTGISWHKVTKKIELEKGGV